MRTTICLLLLTILSSSKNYGQLPQSAAGKIIRYESFKSNYVNARNVDIWIPDDYSTNRKYAVLYMQDGQMLYDSTLTWNKQEWKVDESLNELIKSKQAKECIVVGIWNDGINRFIDYLPQKPVELIDTIELKALFNIPTMITFNADKYLLFITKELKPFIDKEFSTYTDANNTFIMGSSMGGLISLYAICEYPNIFGGAACLSTHWTGIMNHNNIIPNAFKKYIYENLPSPTTHKIYFDYGTETLDILYKPYQMMIDSVMREKGYNINNWTTVEYAGHDHSENSWASRLEVPLKFLLGSNKTNQ